MRTGGDILIAKNKVAKKAYFIKFCGKKFKVLPNVFSPKFFLDPKFFVENMPSQKNKEFLEIDCGTGVMSVNIALKGAKRVVAVDINATAVKNTLENARLYKVANKIQAFKSDVFSALNKNAKFDSIYWNVPFGQVKKRRLSLLERALYDPAYIYLKKFIFKAPKFLKKNGKLLIGFSSSIGDADKMFTFLKQAGFKWKILASASFAKGNPNGSVRFDLLEARL